MKDASAPPPFKPVRRTPLSATREPITLKVPFTTSPLGLAILHNWQQTQTPLYHCAFNRLLDRDLADHAITLPQRRLKAPLPPPCRRTLFKQLRQLKTPFRYFGPHAAKQKRVYPDSEIVLGAMKRAETLYASWRANSQVKSPPIFGGKGNFHRRLQGLITAQEWKTLRTSGPLVLYGHGGGRKQQGGNKKLSLDLEHQQLLFYPEKGLTIALQLQLDPKTPFFQSLTQVQQYCQQAKRDLPLTYSFNLNTQLVSISFPPILQLSPFQRKRKQKMASDQEAYRPIPGRLLALDDNPYNKGYAVLQQQPDGSVKVLATVLWDNSALKPPPGLSSHHPASLKAQNKRLHEERQQAKRIHQLLLHYRCAAYVPELLRLPMQDHGKGKRFNQATNNHWKRSHFNQALKKRLQQDQIPIVPVEPAYSSKLGNRIGREHHIPDPACAAVELGRRALQDEPALQRFILTFRLIFLLLYIQQLITLGTRTGAGKTRIKALHRWKEVAFVDRLPSERLHRVFYQHQWQREKGTTAPCTRRYQLRDLCAQLPPQLVLRFGSVQSARSQVLQIEPARSDDLIIAAPVRGHPQ